MSVGVRIAQELQVPSHKVQAAIELLDGGATVPFVARYRKEATGGLDDAQLRQLETRLRYLRELDADRERIKQVIDEQGKLTPALIAKLDAADNKARLEDLYLPYKKKRRTKAQIARENGLEPLADQLLADPNLTPETLAATFVNDEVPDAKAALDGAQQVLMERLAEDADLVERIRGHYRDHGDLVCQVVEGKEREAAVYRDYFDHREPLLDAPSHRALAMFRGRNAQVLKIGISLPQEEEDGVWAQQTVSLHAGISDQGRPADKWLNRVARWTWRVKLSLRVQLHLLGELRERAEKTAIDVFARNLGDLLLAAPAGTRPTLALDPGLRTGVKVAVLDANGAVLQTTTVYPHAPKRDWEGSLKTLEHLTRQHGVELVAVGNGTASRETEKLAKELAGRCKGITPVMVSEAGASVYSASELASAELPDMDVSLRGAVSIGRRLQDPLAELVKIDPKSIGVGQYQHDVQASALGRALDAVVEDCVNAVGVDLNTASPALLRYVSGVSKTLAERIVAYREANGGFRSRAELMKVPRLGERAFEQCAGFLRVRQGENPLDASAVHPESYPVAKAIAAKLGDALPELIGNGPRLQKVDPRRFVSDTVGLPTVQDILSELQKPGRDPRPEFKTASFADGVETVADVKPGMVLEGVVTNVAAFGAFVDIGVHQDGLVHISQLADRFVKDPAEVVKVGQVVKVTVMAVDLERKRIGLSMRSDASSQPKVGGRGERRRPKQGRNERNRGGRGDRGRNDRSRSDRGRSGRQPRQDDASRSTLADLFKR